AWLEFASAAEASAFEQKAGFLATFSKKADANPSIGFMAAAQAGLQAMHDRNNLVIQLRDRVLDRLFNSQLAALGIRQRPTKGHYPVKIDADDFKHGKVNWKRGTLD